MFLNMLHSGWIVNQRAEVADRSRLILIRATAPQNVCARPCSVVKTAIRRLATSAILLRGLTSWSPGFFWHVCTNKLRFIQVRAPGSRCYCCNSATHQTAHSLYRPFPPERLCNKGVIGLITLCLPIMLLKWSRLFPNTLWQAGEGGGASSISDIF